MILYVLGDTVYANKQSLVGSIGVITVQGAIKGFFDKNKLDRTQITTGEEIEDYKRDWTRYTEVSEKQREDLQNLLETMGEKFRAQVEKHRGEKLDKEKLEQIYSADVVLGEDAVQLGLIDEIGMFDDVMAAKHKGLEVKDYSRRSPLDDIAERFNAGAKAQV